MLTVMNMPAYAQEPSKQMLEFLDTNRASQDSFITTSVVAMGLVAAQLDSKMAECINQWYRASENITENRNSEILKTMRELPQFIPTTIVLAVIERECGKFKDIIK